MSITVMVSPPELLQFLNDNDIEDRVAFIDLEFDQEDESTTSYYLNAVFHPTAISDGIFEKRDYYIGTTGAEISVSFDGGSVANQTAAATLDVTKTTRIEFSRKNDCTLAPKVSVENGGSKASAELGAVTHSSGSVCAFESQFQTKEATLVPTLLGRAISWRFDQDRAKNAVRDFLAGNLYLHAKHTIDAPAHSAKIKFRISDLRFFGPDRSPIDGVRSIKMAVLLRRARRGFDSNKVQNIQLEISKC